MDERNDSTSYEDEAIADALARRSPHRTKVEAGKARRAAEEDERMRELVAAGGRIDTTVTVRHVDPSELPPKRPLHRADLETWPRPKLVDRCVADGHGSARTLSAKRKGELIDLLCPLPPSRPAQAPRALRAVPDPPAAPPPTTITASCPTSGDGAAPREATGPEHSRTGAGEPRSPSPPDPAKTTANAGGDLSSSLVPAGEPPKAPWQQAPSGADYEQRVLERLAQGPCPRSELPKRTVSAAVRLAEAGKIELRGDPDGKYRYHLATDPAPAEPPPPEPPESPADLDRFAAAMPRPDKSGQHLASWQRRRTLWGWYLHHSPATPFAAAHALGYDRPTLAREDVQHLERAGLLYRTGRNVFDWPGSGAGKAAIEFHHAKLTAAQVAKLPDRTPPVRRGGVRGTETTERTGGPVRAHTPAPVLWTCRCEFACAHVEDAREHAAQHHPSDGHGWQQHPPGHKTSEAPFRHEPVVLDGAAAAAKIREQDAAAEHAAALASTLADELEADETSHAPTGSDEAAQQAANDPVPPGRAGDESPAGNAATGGPDRDEHRGTSDKDAAADGREAAASASNEPPKPEPGEDLQLAGPVRAPGMAGPIPNDAHRQAYLHMLYAKATDGLSAQEAADRLERLLGL